MIKYKLSITIIFIATLALFLTGMRSAIETDGIEKKVEDLLRQRVTIMELALSDRITDKKAIHMLMEIEQGNALKTDIRCLEEYRNTDYEKIMSMSIVYIKKMSHIEDILTFDICIEWELHGYNGMSKYRMNYSVGVTEEKNSYKLDTITVYDK